MDFLPNLDTRSWDGKKVIRVAHGDDCVSLMIMDPEGRVEGGIVIAAAQAFVMSSIVERQAQYAREARQRLGG